jgi:hypothetical protein
VSFYVSTATFLLLHCDEWDRVVALPRHPLSSVMQTDVIASILLRMVSDVCQVQHLKLELADGYITIIHTILTPYAPAIKTWMFASAVVSIVVRNTIFRKAPPSVVSGYDKRSINLNKVVATFEKHIFLSQTDLTRTGIISNSCIL